MTKTPPKDVGASVRARLSRLARERGEDFQLVLTRYANERLLFRLASSRQLGMANSRMKDFYDLALLSRELRH